MSKISIEQLRDFQRFIPWDEWPKELKNSSNCISYALGLPVRNPNFFNTIFMGCTAEMAVLKLESILKELELSPRKIEDISQKEQHEYCVLAYCYEYWEYSRFQDCEMRCFETHLVRVEMDGTWTHKFGWEHNPSTTTAEEIHNTILMDDGVNLKGPSAVFAIQKPH